MILDALLGRFSVYRSARGGVWERWEVYGPDEGPVLRWFGPFSQTYRERCASLDAADGAAVSVLRLLDGLDRSEASVLIMARPSLRCRRLPLVTEDHRQRLVS